MAVDDFWYIAQGCDIYGEYIAKVAIAFEQDFNYCGNTSYGYKKINKLTGFMLFLR